MEIIFQHLDGIAPLSFSSRCCCWETLSFNFLSSVRDCLSISLSIPLLQNLALTTVVKVPGNVSWCGSCPLILGNPFELIHWWFPPLHFLHLFSLELYCLDKQMTVGLFLSSNFHVFLHFPSLSFALFSKKFPQLTFQNFWWIIHLFNFQKLYFCSLTSFSFWSHSVLFYGCDIFSSIYSPRPVLIVLLLHFLFLA